MKTRSSFILLLYCVAANIPLWVASQSLGLVVHGLFSVEFAAIGILSFFVRRTVTVWLLLCAIVVDLLYAVCVTYMLSPSDLLRSGQSVLEVVPSHLWNVAGITLVIAVIGLMATSSVPQRRDAERGHGAEMVAVFLFVCVGVDFMTGQIRLLSPGWQLSSIRLTRSAVWSLKQIEWQRRKFRELAAGETEMPVAGASKMVVGPARGSLLSARSAVQPNLVLILVESWGKALSTDVEESLLQPYSDGKLAARYTLNRGTVSFYGPTLAGEARELCGSLIGFGLLAASTAQTKECLPAQFDRMGYRTTGVHGFSSRMFDRGDWYRRIGFGDTWFRDRFEGEGLPLCPGAFPGICDASISKWIGDHLQKDADSPQFIYWVTLNSHLPVPVPNMVEGPPSCSKIEIAAKNQAMCSWYQLIFNVHRSVAELAMRPTRRPTVFVIVGDHAPPFSSLELRSHFSDKVVPYVLLTPKASGVEEGSQTVHSFIATTHGLPGTRTLRLKRTKTPSRWATAG